MPTTTDMISSWFDRAKEAGATHMLVVCDTFDHEDYPVDVNPGTDARKVFAEYNGKNMQRVMEVYDLSMDKFSQLLERRAFHLPPESDADSDATKAVNKVTAPANRAVLTGQPAYGKIGYELPRAIKLVCDIQEGGLKHGGEQYPNLLCAIESAQYLERSIAVNNLAEMVGYSDDAKAAIVGLAGLLKKAWDHGGLDVAGGPTLQQLVAAADLASSTMPQELDTITPQ
jgi:hypothetical protein